MKKSILEKLGTERLIGAYNAYQDDIGGEDHIYEPGDFAEQLIEVKGDALAILDAGFYGNYESNAYAYGLDAYENIVSYENGKDVQDKILGDDDFVKVAQQYLD